jgi:hypothetical protein
MASEPPLPREWRFVKCIAPFGDPLSVTPGYFYQVLPDPAEADGMLRVIDNTGEDYLYEAELFEEIADHVTLLTDLTVALNAPMKAAIFQLANQRGMSMGALVRQWIDERLDLPVQS